jgi:carbohydrate diacid regulator
MAIVSGLFEEVARVVADRAAELLGTHIYVLNGHGALAAASVREESSTHPEWDYHALEPDCLRVPIRLDGQEGAVLVAPPAGGDLLSPRLTRAVIELTVNQAAVLDRLPDQHELKNRFIHDLLRGDAGDEADILRESQILGLDIARPRAVILIDASDYIVDGDSSALGRGTEARLQHSLVRSRLVISSVVRFFRLPSETICAYIGNGEIAILKATSTQDLIDWTSADKTMNRSWANLAALKRAAGGLLDRIRADTGAAINVSIGRYHPGIHGLAHSYEDARAALSLGRRFLGQNRVHCLDELGIAAFVGVSDERIKTDLATHLLSPLDHEPELLQTVAVFLAEDCCPSSTAKRLSIHRNTLTYRLEKSASLTGLDPRRFDDAVQIRLALVVRSLADGPSALCNCPIHVDRPATPIGHLTDAIESRHPAA